MISQEHQRNDSMQEYLAAPHNSSSDLKKILKTTKDYLLYRTPGVETEKPTKAMVQGTVLHSMALEPDIESKDYIIYNPEKRPNKAVNPTTNKPYTMKQKDNAIWLAGLKEDAEKKGLVIVSDEDYDKFKVMIGELQKNTLVMKLLEGTTAENSFYFEQPFMDIIFKGKIRPDAIVENIGKGRPYMISFKTTQDVDPKQFYRTAGRMGYHISDAYYLRWLHFITGEWFQIYQVVLQTSPPYHSLVFDSTPYSIHPDPLTTFDYLNVGDQMCNLAMQRIVDWEMNKKLYGFEHYMNDREDGLITMELPKHLVYEAQNFFE